MKDNKLDVDAFRTLAPELDAETADDEERIIEAILQEGECVARFQWDTGNPGAGAGSETVYRFRGHYFAFPSEMGVAGPFEDWEDALVALELGQPDSDSIVLTPAHWEITCSIMSDDEVAARLQADGPNRPKSVVINGRERTDEGFADEAT